jgi:hypothetical protein
VPKLHLIKSLYVPMNKEGVIRDFDDLCKRKNVKFSNAVIALIEAAMFNVKKSPRKEAGKQNLGLESFSVIRTKSKIYKVKSK